MDKYQAARGSHQISLSMFDLLENAAPQFYNGTNRAAKIRELNDILNDRGQEGRTIQTIMEELQDKAGQLYPKSTEKLCQELLAFQARKSTLLTPYRRKCTQAYHYQYDDFSSKGSLKLIDQRLYDRAFRTGFPPDFFHHSYFDGVTIYCMPDFTELDGSCFQDCSFNVCRIVGAHFYDTSIYGSEFQSCLIQDTSFSIATLDHTHFHDTAMSGISFNSARLSSCNTIDCAMSEVSFHSATLDRCSYGRIKASGIQGLENATITMGGATDRECAQNKASIFEVLGAAPPAPSHKRSAPAPPKPKRHAGPER